MLGTYEDKRDMRKLPECWQTVNDHCPPHFHSSIELTYVTRGELQGVVNGKSYTLAKNQLLICPSYSLHHYETPAAATSLVLTVPTDFVPSFQKQLQKQTFGQMLLTLPERNELLHCLRRLTECTMQPASTTNTALVKGYVYTIMGLLVQQAGLLPIENRQRSDFSREVLLYLQEHFLDALTVQQTADHFGYSKSRFAHLFSQTFGCGFWEYINVLRCRHAAMLLVSEDSPLIDAAMASGYENMRTFYRNFKQVFGTTPTQYLATYTPNDDDARLAR